MEIITNSAAGQDKPSLAYCQPHDTQANRPAYLLDLYRNEMIRGWGLGLEVSPIRPSARRGGSHNGRRTEGPLWSPTNWALSGRRGCVPAADKEGQDRTT